MNMTDTKDKILDAAERLIGEQGYAATSLRHVIAEAGVNLAAVHYHFGSKEGLLDALVLRKATPVNTERLAQLDRVEQEAGENPPPVEKVLEAFLAPAFLLARMSPNFVRVMGRMYGEGMMPVVVARHFQPMVERFRTALERALPDLPREELRWRIHFMIGAMAHSLCSAHAWPKAVGGTAEPVDVRELADRLVTFLGAGLRAATPDSPAAGEK